MVRSFERFRVYYRYVEVLASEGNNDAQVIYERLRPYFARLHKIIAEELKQDLELDIDVVKELVSQGNKKIISLINKEKSLRKELDKDISKQENLLDRN